MSGQAESILMNFRAVSLKIFPSGTRARFAGGIGEVCVEIVGPNERAIEAGIRVIACRQSDIAFKTIAAGDHRTAGHARSRAGKDRIR